MSRMKEYAAQLNAENEVPFGLEGVQTDGSDFMNVGKAPVTVTQSSAPAIPVNMQALMSRFQEQVKAPTVKTQRAKLVMSSTGQRVFEFSDGSQVQNFPCVVVNFAYENNYYATQYIQGEFNPPECFAKGMVPDVMTHSKKAKQPQHANCKDCPMNQFGSSGRGKACRNGIAVALLPLDATSETPFTVLNIAPTGMRNFHEFFRKVARPVPAGGLGLPPQGVEVTARAAATSYPLIEFANAKPLDFSSAFVQMVMSRVQEAEDLLLAEPDFDEILANIEAKSSFKPVRKSRM